MREARTEIDAFVLLGVCFVLGGLALVAPYEVAAFAALAAWVVRARLGRRHVWLLVLLVASVAAGAWRAARATSSHERDRALVIRATGPPARCAASGIVAGSPVVVRGALRWDAALVDVECDGASARWSGRATLYGGPADLARGDRVDVIAQLGPPQRFWNEATGDPRPGEARRGVVASGGAVSVDVCARSASLLAWIDRARASVRARIDATFRPDAAPMARALVLGEEDLTPDDAAAFRTSGLAHLLAVSGMHLVVVVLGGLALLTAVVVRIERIAARVDGGRLVAAWGIPLTWSYALFAGASGSTLRAAWMLTAVLLARALGRRAEGVRAFGLSLVAMAAFDPLVAFDVSFLLSAAATAGLLFLARPLAEAFSRFARVATRGRAPLVWLARSLATTLAATVPCAPILARFAPAMPIGGVFANVVAVPVGESVALPLCLAHALLAPWPAAERGCAWAASGALVVVRAIARACADARVLSLEVPMPTAWQLVAIGVGFAALATMRNAARWGAASVAVAATLVLELGARRAGAPRGIMRATFLDVGQGDAAIVDLPNGDALIIDGGGLVGSPLDVGARVLAPALRAKRRRALAAVILSHPHPDHYGGLGAGLASTRFAALWDTGQAEREGASGPYADLLAAARRSGARVLRPADLCGARTMSGARVEVLAPCPGPSPDRGPNDNSFVVRIAFGRRALLFVGDSESEEERDLLRLAPAAIRADVLKVGHHGSRTSSSAAFIAAVAPAHAIVSSGIRNRFGHPHPVTLATLSRAGARVWRTDLVGAIVVETDGEQLDVRGASGEHGDP